MRVAIVAERTAAGIAGLDGSFEWGEAVTSTPPQPPDAGPTCAGSAVRVRPIRGGG